MERCTNSVHTEPLNYIAAADETYLGCDWPPLIVVDGGDRRRLSALGGVSWRWPRIVTIVIERYGRGFSYAQSVRRENFMNMAMIVVGRRCLPAAVDKC